MARKQIVPVYAANKFGGRKKRIYLAITVILLLLLAITAISILHSASER